MINEQRSTTQKCAGRPLLFYSLIFEIAHCLADNTVQYGVLTIILRWLLQRGIVAIPKSVHKARMRENIDVFDFELSEADMQLMSSLDKNESQFFDHRDPAAIESIFGQSMKALRD